MFFISKRKTKLIDSDFFNGLTDSHNHILFGVDDGVKEEAETMQTLAYYDSLGVSNVTLTPHINISTTQESLDLMQTRFEQIKGSYQGAIKFRLAAEYMLDSGFLARLDQPLRTVAEDRILVETSYFAAPNNLSLMLYEVSNKELTAVLAHPERYTYIKKEGYTDFKSKGYELQLNLLSLSGYYGKTALEKALYMLDQGMYSMVGSDLHKLSNFQGWVDRIKLSSKQIDSLNKIK